jgi:hypothetical protein
MKWASLGAGWGSDPEDDECGGGALSASGERTGGAKVFKTLVARRVLIWSIHGAFQRLGRPTIEILPWEADRSFALRCPWKSGVRGDNGVGLAR